MAVAAIILVVIVCTFVFTTNAKPTATVAQQLYPLTCRGGGSLSITNEGRGVRIDFQKGAGAVTDGLKPGQCTWSDRALRSGEALILQDTGARASQYVSDLVQADKHVILQVYNAGDHLRVMRVGP